jgi:pilus assembly protein CpaE
MFQIFLIASDHVRFRLLQYAAVDSKKVDLVRTFDRYPIAGELARHLHTVPDAVFLDFTDRGTALDLAAVLRANSPDVPIVAIINDPEDRSWLADEGIIASLVYPCTTEDFEFALHIAILSVKTSVNPDLFAFLPAKAGSGSSTIALNTAAALANRLDRKTLLIEADLRSGVLSLALSCDPPGSTQQAVQPGQEIDSFVWDRWCATYGQLHLLLSNRSIPDTPPSWTEYHALLNSAINRFQKVLVDLPELVNPGTSEIVRNAGAVFVVCTQEILSLRLAEQRFKELIDWGVKEENIRVLVNRWHDSELSRDDVLRILRRPIAAVFPNNYRVVRKALVDGETVSEDSTLGAAFLQFASKLAGLPAPSHSRWHLSKVLHSLARR